MLRYVKCIKDNEEKVYAYKKYIFFGTVLLLEK